MESFLFVVFWSILVFLSVALVLIQCQTYEKLKNEFEALDDVIFLKRVILFLESSESEAGLCLVYL